MNDLNNNIMQKSIVEYQSLALNAHEFIEFQFMIVDDPE